MSRPTIDEWAMALAKVTASRATCARRQVGCILLDARGQVLATGYNGPASKQPHCDEHRPCPGYNEPSGEGLDLCEAIHAEQNALLQCRDVHIINRCYVTTAPCIHCTKMLLNTSCQEIIALGAYRHTDAEVLWLGSSRQWRVLTTSERFFVDLALIKSNR